MYREGGMEFRIVQGESWCSRRIMQVERMEDCWIAHEIAVHRKRSIVGVVDRVVVYLHVDVVYTYKGGKGG